MKRCKGCDRPISPYIVTNFCDRCGPYRPEIEAAIQEENDLEPRQGSFERERISQQQVPHVGKTRTNLRDRGDNE